MHCHCPALVHSCNLSGGRRQEGRAEAGGSLGLSLACFTWEVPGESGLHIGTLSFSDSGALWINVEQSCKYQSSKTEVLGAERREGEQLQLESMAVEVC